MTTKDPIRCRWCARELTRETWRSSGFKIVRTDDVETHVPLYECRDIHRCQSPINKRNVVEPLRQR